MFVPGSTLGEPVDLPRRLLEIVQVSHFHVCLNRIVDPPPPPIPSTYHTPTGVITALAVAVAVLAVALLSSIGVAVYRWRAHYSRAV